MRVGQGRENSKQFLRENPDLFAEIRERIMVAKGLVETEESPAEASADSPAESVPTEEVPAG